jgi:hypothetical protein
VPQAYHVFGKTLRQANVVTLLDKVPDGESVLVSVSTSEALVGHVKERVVALLLHDIANLFPLLHGRVDSGRVVGASVQQDDAAFWCVLDVFDHTFKVQPDGVLVVVPVLYNLEPTVGEDGIVVCPRGVWNVDLLCTWVVTLQEFASDTERSRARNGLCDGDAVFLDGGRIVAVGKNSGGLGEGRHTRDTSVFLVEARLDDLLLCLAYGWEDVRFTLVVALRGSQHQQLRHRTSRARHQQAAAAKPSRRLGRTHGRHQHPS